MSPTTSPEVVNTGPPVPPVPSDRSTGNTRALVRLMNPGVHPLFRPRGAASAKISCSREADGGLLLEHPSGTGAIDAITAGLIRITAMSR